MESGSVRQGYARIAWMLVGLAAAGCASPQPPPPVAVERMEWRPAKGIHGIELKTDHFDLRLTADDPVLREYLPGFLETCLAQYRKLAPPPGERHELLGVYLFETKSEWIAFTRQFAPARASVYLHIQAGAYMDTDTATTVAYDLGRDQTLALLAHEGFHQYLAAYFPEPVVAWLNEGLATQWEAFELAGDRPVFTPERNLFRKNSLREALYGGTGWTPLKRLLSMHAGQAVVQTGQATRGYYAQIWALVLFLREGGFKNAYAPRFARLLGDMGSPRLRQAARAYRIATPGAGDISEGEAIFRYYISENLEAFDDEYRAFARQRVDG